ncbi:MAG TPA: protein kinase [Gemmataceae bacterium]|nr:protein kinase [Gemmataceae bacterium]
MRPSDPPSSFETAATATFDPEKLLLAFEQAWQSGSRPPLETLLSQLPASDPATESARQRLLVEMVKIDLEYRWRGSTSPVADDLPARPLLEDYLRRFPALGPLERLSPELIGEEYRVRWLWGDRPNAHIYYARFPTHADLPALLTRIDAQLAERVMRTTLHTTAPPDQMAGPPRAVPDGYEILGELGRGGMGVVYKARQLRLNRLVAIKMIRAGQETTPATLARFRTEAEAAARVQHPHVVQVHEVGEKDGQPYCVMEYVNGGSLTRCLAGTPLEPKAAARLLETLAGAVQAIHDQGILHRDLKPANILLHLAGTDDSSTLTSDLLQSPVCVPKISDFGLAKPAESAGLTQTGMVLGTPSYMAPEQADSRSDAFDPATDVYGLGAIFYELLTGRPPFRGITVLETLEQVRRHDPLPPRQLQPAVPRDLDTICLKCLQKEPAKRYASATDLADDLERFRQCRPILARPAGRWERALKWARRRPALAILAAAVILGFFAALAGGLTYTLHLRAARAETERQRQQAGRSYRKSLEAVEQMLVNMGARRMEAIPGTEKAQVDALKGAVRLYQELLDEQEQPDPDLYVRLGFTLSYLGNRQMGLGNPDEAEGNCRRSLELLAHLPDDLRDSRACRQQSAYGRYILGNILEAKDRRTESERLYREACDILAPLADDIEARHLLGSCYTGLSLVSKDLTQNRELNRQALHLREEIYKKDPNNWYYRNKVCESLFNLARVDLSSGRADEAEKLFQRCLNLLGPLVEGAAKTTDQSVHRVYAQSIQLNCYTGLGMVWTNRGKADKSEQFHLKAIALGEEMIRLYPEPSHRQELAQAYLNLGAAYQVSQQPKKAEETYRKAAAIQEVLVRDLPDIALHRLSLARTYVNLALLYSGGRTKEALALFQRGRTLLEPLCREHPEDIGYADALSGNYNNQALLLRNRGEPRQALPWNDRAVAVASQAHRLDPTDAGITHCYAMALGSRASTWMALQEYKKALADWDRLLEVAGPPESDKNRHWRALTLTKLGDHRQAAEDVAQALRRRGISQSERYLCACVLAHALAAAQKDPHLNSEHRKQAEDEYAARAIEVLTQLRREGYFRNLLTWLGLVMDADLAALRAREDFKRWRSKLTD